MESTAASQVFDTAELLEAILLELKCNKTLLLSQRVSKTFEAGISGSVKLQRKMYFASEPCDSSKTFQQVNYLIYNRHMPTSYGEDFDICCQQAQGLAEGSVQITLTFGKHFSPALTGSWRRMRIYRHTKRVVSVRATQGDWRKTKIWHLGGPFEDELTMEKMFELLMKVIPCYSLSVHYRP